MLSDTKSSHVTQVGGNVFADLGFELEEALALQAESKRLIAQAKAAMVEFKFTLSFKLYADDLGLQDITERLCAAGCIDALVGIGPEGKVVMEFTRQSSSRGEAIRSAVVDVLAAIPTAVLI